MNERREGVKLATEGLTWSILRVLCSRNCRAHFLRLLATMNRLGTRRDKEGAEVEAAAAAAAAADVAW